MDVSDDDRGLGADPGEPFLGTDGQHRLYSTTCYIVCKKVALLFLAQFQGRESAFRVSFDFAEVDFFLFSPSREKFRVGASPPPLRYFIAEEQSDQMFTRRLEDIS